MRIFQLDRKEDVSGVSGTGIVAEGVQFSSGKVVISWLSENTSIAVYDSLGMARNVHCHGGKTVVVWIDPEASPKSQGKLTVLKRAPDGTLLVGDVFGGTFLISKDRVPYEELSGDPVIVVDPRSDTVSELCVVPALLTLSDPPPVRQIRLTHRDFRKLSATCGYDPVGKQWYMLWDD